jgi:predicted RNA methylase
MSALARLLEKLEEDDSLDRAGRLHERLDAVDHLEAYSFLDPEAGADSESRHDVRRDAETIESLEQERTLRARTMAMVRRLEAANGACYETLRRAIRQGEGAERLHELVAHAPAAAAMVDGDRYDHLDALVSGILQFAEPDAEIAEIEAEMVFYQPTPARHIFDLFARTALTKHDVLVDLGSGLGHVPLLAAICTPARSIGVEREAAYVECARSTVLALNLARATFVRQDARDADLSTGTVFYLYTPFSGAILRHVLDALRRQAVARSIRVCTYGPCTSVVAAEEWLEAIGDVDNGRIAIFRSHAPVRTLL